MKIQIKARFSGAILFKGEYESTKHAVIDAVKKGADLGGAYLRGADLGGAYLRGAYLGGADLGGTKEKPEKIIKVDGILQIGAIGSRADFLLAFDTEDCGIIIKAGCFTGTLAEFTKAVKEKHKSGQYLAEYKAAIAMIKATFKARSK